MANPPVAVEVSEPAAATHIVVAGVPEHYNAPWLMYPEMFSEAGVDLKFVEMPGGTGAMVSALRTADVDMAVALTEGLIADIALKGSNDYLIVSPYVSIPLRWALWALPESPLHSLADCRGRTFGISRLGSGSHLMAAVLHRTEGWGASELRLSPPCGSLDGLVASLRAGTSDVFLWSYSMTKPLADAGHLRHVGDLYTPWPCFMVAVRRDALAAKRHAVETVLRVVKRASARFLSTREASVAWVVAKYGIARPDVEEWFSTLGYASNNHVGDDVLGLTISTLREAAIIQSNPDRADLVEEVGGALTPKSPVPEIAWRLDRTPHEMGEAFLSSPAVDAGSVASLL